VNGTAAPTALMDELELAAPFAWVNTLFTTSHSLFEKNASFKCQIYLLLTFPCVLLFITLSPLVIGAIDNLRYTRGTLGNSYFGTKVANLTKMLEWEQVRSSTLFFGEISEADTLLSQYALTDTARWGLENFLVNGEDELLLATSEGVQDHSELNDELLNSVYFVNGVASLAQIVDMRESLWETIVNNSYHPPIREFNDYLLYYSDITASFKNVLKKSAAQASDRTRYSTVFALYSFAKEYCGQERAAGSLIFGTKQNDVTNFYNYYHA